MNGVITLIRPAIASFVGGYKLSRLKDANGGPTSDVIPSRVVHGLDVLEIPDSEHNRGVARSRVRPGCFLVLPGDGQDVEAILASKAPAEPVKAAEKPQEPPVPPTPPEGQDGDEGDEEDDGGAQDGEGPEPPEATFDSPGEGAPPAPAPGRKGGRRNGGR